MRTQYLLYSSAQEMSMKQHLPLPPPPQTVRVREYIFEVIFNAPYSLNSEEFENMLLSDGPRLQNLETWFEISV